MTLKKNIKSPEGKILEDIKNNKWRFGTATNDGHILAAKRINSPDKKAVIAVAIIKSERREVWFTSLERLRIFREECMLPFEIIYLNSESD